MRRDSPDRVISGSAAAVDQGGSGGTVIDPVTPTPKTGDEFSPVWYVLAPGAAALIVIITGINTKRRHKRG